jgi:hypothetical protein
MRCGYVSKEGPLGERNITLQYAVSASRFFYCREATFAHAGAATLLIRWGE